MRFYRISTKYITKVIFMRKERFKMYLIALGITISMSSCEQEREDVRNVLGNHPKFLTVTEAF